MFRWSSIDLLLMFVLQSVRSGSVVLEPLILA